MEFAPDLIEMDAEAERTASQDTKEEARKLLNVQHAIWF